MWDVEASFRTLNMWTFDGPESFFFVILQIMVGDLLLKDSSKAFNITSFGPSSAKDYVL